VPALVDAVHLFAVRTQQFKAGLDYADKAKIEGEIMKAFPNIEIPEPEQRPAPHPQQRKAQSPKGVKV